jgi:hypothetical protein
VVKPPLDVPTCTTGLWATLVHPPTPRAHVDMVESTVPNITTVVPSPIRPYAPAGIATGADVNCIPAGTCGGGGTVVVVGATVVGVVVDAATAMESAGALVPFVDAVVSGAAPLLPEHPTNTTPTTRTAPSRRPRTREAYAQLSSPCGVRWRTQVGVKHSTLTWLRVSTAVL